MEEEKYYQKYLKYKQKYLDLQKLKGGDTNSNVDICNTSFGKLIESNILDYKFKDIYLKRIFGEVRNMKVNGRCFTLELSSNIGNISCGEQIKTFIFLESLIHILFFVKDNDILMRNAAFYEIKIKDHFIIDKSMEKTDVITKLTNKYCNIIKSIRKRENKKWFFNKTNYGDIGNLLTIIKDDDNCFDSNNRYEQYLIILIFIIFDKVMGYLKNKGIKFDMNKIKILDLLKLLCPNDIYEIMTKEEWDDIFNDMVQLYHNEYYIKIKKIYENFYNSPEELKQYILSTRV